VRIVSRGFTSRVNGAPCSGTMEICILLCVVGRGRRTCPVGRKPLKIIVSTRHHSASSKNAVYIATSGDMREVGASLCDEGGGEKADILSTKIMPTAICYLPIHVPWFRAATPYLCVHPFLLSPPRPRRCRTNYTSVTPPPLPTIHQDVAQQRRHRDGRVSR
jgi:hypothetical protein